MAPQPPLILADNVFDRINLYPGAVLSSSGAAAGTDVRYVADYRRERTQWKAATSAGSRYVHVDLGAGNTRAVDFCWIDRGHNLWGLSASVEASTDNVAWPDSVTRVVPAQGTVGGDPLTTWCVTEEGALYTLFAAFAARRYFRFLIGSVAQPIITGIILGARHQLLNYSSRRDEDAGERNEKTQDSDALWEGEERTYHRRTFELALDLIGAAEYDSTIRSLRRTLFEKGQRAVIVANYGTNSERAWLYRYMGRQFGAPMNAAHRRLTIAMRESGPLIR